LKEIDPAPGTLAAGEVKLLDKVKGTKGKQVFKGGGKKKRE